MLLLGFFGGERGSATSDSSPSKDEGALKMVNMAVDALKIHTVKVVEALPVIMVNVAGSILIILGKSVEFVDEHTWALVVFIPEIVGVRLM